MSSNKNNGCNSGDLFSYCHICMLNHAQKRKHIFTNKHKQRLKSILKKYGAKIKLCRPYLDNPLIQEGEYEPGAKFWCHFCRDNFNKHVTDQQKSIVNGGVLEHIASDQHWRATETFWSENGVEQKFKSGFIVPEKDFKFYKDKLTQLVDKYETKANEKTKAIGEEIKLNENTRLFCDYECQEENSVKERIIYRTVRSKFGILQNPTGYHDGVRVWRGGIVKYKEGSDQLIPSKFNNQFVSISYVKHQTRNLMYTVSAEANSLSAVSIKIDNTRGNIHSGATPPWLIEDGTADDSELRTAGPCEEEFRKHQKRLAKSKLNPNRVGAHFDHTVKNIDNDWLPSFGRVWNDEARWKSRKQYKSELQLDNNDVKKRKK